MLPLNFAVYLTLVLFISQTSLSLQPPLEQTHNAGPLLMDNHINKLREMVADIADDFLVRIDNHFRERLASRSSIDQNDVDHYHETRTSFLKSIHTLNETLPVLVEGIVELRGFVTRSDSPDDLHYQNWLPPLALIFWSIVMWEAVKRLPGLFNRSSVETTRERLTNYMEKNFPDLNQYGKLYGFIF